MCRCAVTEHGPTEYQQLAKQFAAQWVKAADDGDHFRLAFDRPGSWSQKYNLVWDRILGLGLFPDEVLRKEMDYYKQIQNPYGLPLDNRKAYTKLDWILWTATLTQDRVRLRGTGGSGGEIPQRDTRPRPHDRLVRDRHGAAHGIHGAAGGRRRVPADALRQVGLEQVRAARQEPRPPAGLLCLCRHAR